MLAGWELLMALAAAFAGAVVMGTVSFGLGLVAAPPLLLVLEPQAVVVIVNTSITFVLLLALARTWRHLRLERIWGMTLAGLAAVPIGVLALANANPGLLRLVIAAVILALGVMSLFNLRLPLAGHRAAGPVFGFCASLAVTALSIGGPLAALYVLSRGWPRDEMRAALAFYFLAADLASLAFYWRAGLVNREVLVNIGLLAPGLLAGFGVALFIAPRINERMFRYVAIVIIISGSLTLLGKELL